MDKPICDRMVVELSADFAVRCFSAVEVTKAPLDRTAKLNPRINAIVTLNPAALAEVKESDIRCKIGKSLGSLDGVPYFAKDNLDTAGLHATFGSQLMADYVPIEESIGHGV